MSEQKIIDLIKASQAVIKNELLPQSGSQKYNLLMLMRSLEILQAYILQKIPVHCIVQAFYKIIFHFQLKILMRQLNCLLAISVKVNNRIKL